MITETGAKALEILQLQTQAETLDLLVQGLRQTEIAHLRGISSETIKQHLQRARRILQARNNCALVAITVQYRWIILDEEPDLHLTGSFRDWLPRT